MNEAETRAELIDPALRAAGWGVVEGTRVRREYKITLGRLQGAAGRRNAADIADYILEYRGRMVAVVEAKKASEPVTQGLGQAKKYADKLKLRHAFSTNGKGIYQVDMLTGREGNVEAWPTPEELWGLTTGLATLQRGPDAGQEPGEPSGEPSVDWQDRFGAVPFEDKSGSWQPRYYQDIAIQRVLDAIAQEKERILLTLATGTGKTAIAFQIAWKLFHARWNSRRDGSVGRASSSSPTATSSRTRPTIRSPRFPRMRWCGSTRRASAGGARCPPTAACSSPSSRPS